MVAMPLYMTLAGNFGYGRSPAPAFNSIDLIGFSNWHTSNSSTFTSNIPNFYFYQFDGSPSTIQDGGYNMWNIGNYLTLSGITTASTIRYGTLSNVSASNYGYYVSQPNVWPQVELAYMRSGEIAWHNAGSPGTAGSPFASNVNSSGYYTTTNQGRYGSYWTNQNYGTANPTICYVWFTIQQPNFNSGISAINDFRNFISPPRSEYTQSFSIVGNNILVGQMLLSVRNSLAFPNGYLIPDIAIVNFLSNYVQNANITII